MPDGWSFSDEPVQKYLRDMFFLSVQSADRFCEKHALAPEQRVIIILEFLYLFLNLTDRAAFGRIEDKKRHNVMNSLESLSIYSAVDALYFGWPKEKIEEIKQECMERFLARIEEWGSVQKLFPDENEGLKNTLFWEFGKSVARLTGKDNDLNYIMNTVFLVTESVMSLNPIGFIDFVK